MLRLRMTSPNSPWMSSMRSMVLPTNSRLYSKYSSWKGTYGELT